MADSTSPNPRVGSQSDTEFAASARTVYQTLFARYQSNTDILWRVIAFSLVAEATLWVAIAGTSVRSTWARVLLGMGLLLFGLAGPQTIRFIENSLMVDRHSLDLLERALLPDRPEFYQHHGERAKDRYNLIRARVAEFNPAGLSSLEKRRLSKADSPAWVRRLEVVLDLLAQPSIVWTAVIAAAGAVGFMVSTSAATDHLYLEIPLDIVSGSAVASLWMIANGWITGLGRIFRASLARKARLR